MRNKILMMSALGMMATICATAQEQDWTLKRCVDYAIEHNVTVRQRQITKDQRENDVSTAKGNYLPSVGAYVYQNFDFGRGLTINNTYETSKRRQKTSRPPRKT